MKRAIAAVTLLAGCGVLQPPPPESGAASGAAPVREASPARATTSAELMAYLGRIRSLSESQLAAEAARQRRAEDDVSRVKAGIALTLAHAEESEIVALVEPIARRTAADPDARAMAGFLQVLAADRRRLRESAAAAANRLRDERRAQEAMKQKADAAAERAAQLQQKLDALTEIERSLSDRQVPNR
jgi:hypothetical protein